ncbi:MAG: tetratricopeptide repeat protein [Nitrospirae bacterium]|nr:tetratricopeptide repeat protein [Nitrospirota bacterium]
MEHQEKIEGLRRLYEQIYDLYVAGTDNECEALIKEALEQSVGDEAYCLFFEGLRARYIDTDYELQEKLLRNAVEVSPMDYFLIRNLGIPLYYQGKYDESIQCYDEALKINPDDYRALRNKGMSLSNQGKDDEAIRCFDEALRIKSDYYLTFTSKGISLSNQGKDDEAIRCFDEALRIKSDCYDALTGKGLSLSNQGKEGEAFKLIKEAYKIAPVDDDYTTQVLENMCKILGQDLHKVVNEIEKSRTITGIAFERTPKGLAMLRLLIKGVKEEFKGKIDEFERDMDGFEENKNRFFTPKSCIKQDFPLLLTLRKWNSYTPIIPSDGEERSIGGGYFIYYRGKGTVIDPGYNFIENFYRAGGRVFDIDNVVLTHAHNDHTIDFESIMTLIYQYNDENEFGVDKPEHKSITLYMNAGSFMKFSGFLNLRDCDYIKNVFTLTAGNTYKIDEGFTMAALPAYHDEIITKKYAVGLHLAFDCGKDDSGNDVKRNIIFTSDTGLFPKKDKDTVDINKDEIHISYRDTIKVEDVNLLVAHLGSIRPKEIREEKDLGKMFYPNHLGLLGTARMITVIKPRLAVVSEFGEELRNFRDDLMEMLGRMVEQHLKNKKDEEVTKVLPADLPFIYNIKSEEIYCMVSDKMVDYKQISAELIDSVFYYSCAKPKTEKKKVEVEIDKYKGYLRNGKLPYLKDPGTC